jgi:hypothetical protein
MTTRRADQTAFLVGLCVLLMGPRAALANGHGPVFGLSTPTNVEDGWSLDTSFMGTGGGAGSGSMFRTMLAYGITPDLQVSLSVPALFTSLGTILCCALPLALVMLGLGATWAPLVSNVSWLVALSHHKKLVFALAGALILGNLVYVYGVAPRLRARGVTCGIDGLSACNTVSRLSRVAVWCSAAIWLAGFSVAYVLPLVMGF